MLTLYWKAREELTLADNQVRLDVKAKEIKAIRKSTGFSQKLFACYMGVSDKTVEAWEAGTNRPSGASSRILNMMELNENLVREFPFVKVLSK